MGEKKMSQFEVEARKSAEEIKEETLSFNVQKAHHEADAVVLQCKQDVLEAKAILAAKKQEYTAGDAAFTEVLDADETVKFMEAALETATKMRDFYFA